MNPRVAVVGGGVTGLATAYYLQKFFRENRVRAEVVLYEGSPRTGGIMDTEEAGGFILEKGPDSFITDKPRALALSRELGLEKEIIGTNKAYRRSFIARSGKLLPVPEGFYLVAPLKSGSFLSSSIISLPGKLRMMAEPFLPAKKDWSDESVASFVRRRFGAEALNRVGQPMIGGIYTGDPERLGLAATMPRFLRLERQYGSLTRGLQAEARQKKSAATEASGPRYSLFVSFRRGMRVFSDALAAALPEGCVQTGRAIRAIRPVSGKAGWVLDLGPEGEGVYDAVCVTSSARLASACLKESLPDISSKLSQLSYESVATVNLGYEAAALKHPLNGFGFVVPKTEKKSVIACSFSSRKFEGRAPAGHVLLRAFVGGAFGREELQKPDEEILAAVQNELSVYLGVRGKPVLTRFQRHDSAMVQYAVGHLDWLSAVRESLPEGLYLAGASYDGVGIPDCVASAEAQAGKIFEMLSEPKF